MFKKAKRKTARDFAREGDALWQSIKRARGQDDLEEPKKTGKQGVLDELDYISDLGEADQYGSYGRTYDYDLTGEYYRAPDLSKGKPKDFGEAMGYLKGAVQGEIRKNKFWKDYEDTGYWRGYSALAEPTLDYRYIEQMANMFSAKYAVDVKVGDTMSIDLETKTLVYNPTQLMFGSKANLIASLLHEIGHLRHTTPAKNITSPFLTKYQKPAFEVLNIFEDFRVDALMKKSYQGAEEVFASQMPKIREMAEGYQTRAEKALAWIEREMLNDERYKPADLKKGDLVVLAPEARHYGSHGKKRGEIITAIVHEEEPDEENDDGYMEDIRFIVLWDGDKNDQTTHPLRELVLQDPEKEKARWPQTETELEEKIAKIRASFLNRETFFDYCHAVLLTGYGDKPKNLKGKLAERIKKTEGAIKPCVAAKSTQGMATILDRDVYPVIEDLMRDFQEGTPEMKEALGPSRAQQLMARAIAYAEGETGGEEIGEQQPGTRGGSNRSDNLVPGTWKNGEYAPLKESVDSAIKEMVRRLTFIRRTEASPKWEAKKRRGALDGRSLYRFRMGDTRLFQKKVEVKDTIRSFAFSLMVDRSGSMRDDERQVHAARALVLLAEVFERMGIPYEIQTFGNNFTRIKAFEDTLDAGKKKTIAGLTDAADGSTNLYLVQDEPSKAIKERPERHKYAIILSDGGVGNNKDPFWSNLWAAWKKNRLEPLGVGVSCGEEIVKLCGDQGVSVDNAAQLPTAFTDMLKGLIESKRAK